MRAENRRLPNDEERIMKARASELIAIFVASLKTASKERS